MTEEERRRRLGIQTTPEYEDYLMRVVQARAAGLPDPAPLVGVPEEAQPTSRAAMMQPGEQRLIRPYVDPRDEAIASGPALVRPVHSILDRMLRPGRAGTADRMNREYMEGLLQRDADQRRGLAERQLIEAQGQKMQADAVVAGLQRTIAEGNEDERKAAAAKLREIGLATGRVAPQGMDFSQLFGTGGSRFTPSGEEVIPKAAGDTPVATTPQGEVVNPYMDMTRDEAVNTYARDVRAVDNRIARANRILNVESGAGGGWKASDLYEAGIPLTSAESTPNRKIEARETLRRGEFEKEALKNRLLQAHPNVANLNIL
tara:strand:- start:8 stop:958 length:951 start_codon:yes stop_codon:yes gene_type:complete